MTAIDASMPTAEIADVPKRGGGAVLFTGFEPSGDDHASIVIAELKRRHPDLPIYAWGGPKMERAGAVIVERTGESAVMGIPGVGKIIEHVKINRRVRRWMDRNPVAVHIPVDSPDANFPICRMAKERGAKVVHMVAPQLWAWREGRIKKLRRLTDMVLCVLPFEEEWFRSRSVPAKFIGHPQFNQPLDFEALDRRAAELPQGTPRIAFMPGSRPGEIRRSFPPMLDAYRRLKLDFPNLSVVMALTKPEVEQRLRKAAAGMGGWPEGMHTVVGDTDLVVRWCEMAVVASGTVTLQVAKQIKPMVTFYRFGRHMKLPHVLFGHLIFKTKFFTLPNLIAGRQVVPELVPYFGDGHALAVACYRIMRQPGYAEDQRAGLREIVAKLEGRLAGPSAADEIEKIIGLVPK
ncbi:MAG: lipid-A-disaccharide synthase [Phycisphaerales bacterium]